VNTIVLPAGQAYFSISTFTLPRFEHVQRSKETHQRRSNRDRRTRYSRSLSFPIMTLVDDEVVPLCGHSRDGMTHALHGALNDRTCPDKMDGLPRSWIVSKIKPSGWPNIPFVACR